MDIDKLIPSSRSLAPALSFSSLMDIDKLIHHASRQLHHHGLSSLMDIDKPVKLLHFQKILLSPVKKSSRVHFDLHTGLFYSPRLSPNCASTAIEEIKESGRFL